MADAFLIPRHYPAGKVQDDRLLALKNEFGPLLNSKVVQVSGVHLGARLVSLLRADANHPSYYFPKFHPKEGQDRYTWVDRGDGVLEGTLVPDGEGTADAH